MSYDIYRIYAEDLITAQCYSIKLIHTVSRLDIVKELLATSEHHNWLCMAYPAKKHKENYYIKRHGKALKHTNTQHEIPSYEPVMATHNAMLFMKALKRQKEKENADYIQYTSTNKIADVKGYSCTPAILPSESQCSQLSL